ncbi:olfactory receptor 5AS1-like isoform X2 [Numida meleagris]|uniref:olfactory receptor 5AS1-like isoform X2 n=1 Tax=Numida meleagris TaxID=8996 RepID=UPI000B3DAD4D|nr:olfactory receptor 5AS1-like isoform X2 [Numida meleagris]
MLKNHTAVTEFILLGFTGRREVKFSLFGLFLLIYVTTLGGNAGIIVLVRLNAHLHMPMYYFLSNLSFLDLSYASAIAPKLLVNLVAQRTTISFLGCATQMFLFAALADAECFLLAVMAYDRYVAICRPFLYSVAMSHRACASMVAGAYLSGGLTSLVHTSFTFTLSFCGSNTINHFFCDIPPLLELSCSNTKVNEVLLFTLCGFIQTSTFLVIVISYTCILGTILRLHAAEGRRKAFSTCTSHLTAIGFFYGSLLFMYLRLTSVYSSDTNKLITLSCTMVFPMLNPMIYSLRNKEVKEALRKSLERKVFSRSFT